jgi:hypothetical protein
MILTLALLVFAFAIGAMCALSYRVSILLIAMPLVALGAGVAAQEMQSEAPIFAALACAVSASLGYLASTLAGGKLHKPQQ